MRRRWSGASKILMLGAGALAVTTTFVLEGHLSRLEARAAAGGDLLEVVSAATTLPRGAVLGPASVRLSSIPSGGAPPMALRRLDDALGRTVVTDVAAGEVLTRLRIAGGGPLAAITPSGYRAVPIRASLPHDLVTPGDRIDVLATYVAASPYTETVLREAEVLSVVPAGALDEGGGSTALLVAATPSEAERLLHAQALASLSVAIAPP